MAPIVVLGPLGGIVADRVDRRVLMIGADAVRMVLMVALAIVAAAGPPLLLAPVLAAAATAASTVAMPSVAASTARLVDADDLQRASALRAGIGQGAIVVGLALGALVLALSDPAVAIPLNAVSFAISAAAILAIGPSPAFEPRAAGGGELPSLVADLKARRCLLRRPLTATPAVAPAH